MKSDSARAAREQGALRLSIWGAVFMAALGLGFAPITDSEAILLDGVFSLLGGALALASLRVAQMTLRPDDERFPFGYSGFESLINLVKGLAIALVSVFALFSAVEALFEGGRPISSGPAVLYGLIAAGGCFAFAWRQSSTAKATGSSLVEVDAKNWIVDGAISSVVTLGFVGARLMVGTSLERWLPYVDPVLVIVVVLATVLVPFGIISQGLRELLLAGPGPEVYRRIEATLDRVLEPIGVRECLPRLVRRGRQHYLHVSLVVAADSPLATVTAEDELRQTLYEALEPELGSLSLDLFVTRSPSWAIAGKPELGSTAGAGSAAVAAVAEASPEAQGATRDQS